MFLSPAVYVLEPLQIAMATTFMCVDIPKQCASNSRLTRLGSAFACFGALFLRPAEDDSPGDCEAR
jgi:hypothetical protein